MQPMASSIRSGPAIPSPSISPIPYNVRRGSDRLITFETTFVGRTYRLHKDRWRRVNESNSHADLTNTCLAVGIGLQGDLKLAACTPTAEATSQAQVPLDSKGNRPFPPKRIITAGIHAESPHLNCEHSGSASGGTIYTGAMGDDGVMNSATGPVHGPVVQAHSIGSVGFHHSSLPHLSLEVTADRSAIEAQPTWAEYIDEWVESERLRLTAMAAEYEWTANGHRRGIFKRRDVESRTEAAYTLQVESYLQRAVPILWERTRTNLAKSTVSTVTLHARNTGEFHLTDVIVGLEVAPPGTILRSNGYAPWPVLPRAPATPGATGNRRQRQWIADYPSSKYLIHGDRSIQEGEQRDEFEVPMLRAGDTWELGDIVLHISQSAAIDELIIRCHGTSSNTRGRLTTAIPLQILDSTLDVTAISKPGTPEDLPSSTELDKEERASPDYYDDF